MERRCPCCRAVERIPLDSLLHDGERLVRADEQEWPDE
jgi:hypothetical protein